MKLRPTRYSVSAGVVVAGGAMHEGMAGVGRAQVISLAGIGADRLGAEAEDIALVHQELDRLDVRSRRVLAGFVIVLVGRGIAHLVPALRPVGAHQDPRT